jgi:antitoxin PrlF
MSSATVTSKGQLTIPALVRDEFGIVPGHRIIFFKKADGGLGIKLIQPKPGSGRGGLQHLADPKFASTLDSDINDAMAENAMAGDLPIDRAA